MNRLQKIGLGAIIAGALATATYFVKDKIDHYQSESRIEHVVKNPEIRVKSFEVLRETNCPAVLIESFNLLSDKQRNYYKKNSNLENLTDTYIQGITAYLKKNPQIKTIVIDDAHGNHERPKTGGVNENYFAKKMQANVADGLKDYSNANNKKMSIKEITYNGCGKDNARLDYFTRIANQYPASGTLYLSFHTDAISDHRRIPPTPYISVKGGESEELATCILDAITIHYDSKSGLIRR